MKKRKELCLEDILCGIKREKKWEKIEFVDESEKKFPIKYGTLDLIFGGNNWPILFCGISISSGKVSSPFWCD